MPLATVIFQDQILYAACHNGIAVESLKIVVGDFDSFVDLWRVGGVKARNADGNKVIGAPQRGATDKAVATNRKVADASRFVPEF